MIKEHSSLPNCPFCFKGFPTYNSLRKHCEASHSENQQNVKKKRPCRFFQNGAGKCVPPSGTCAYDHTIIPDSERELCRHKEARTYQPNCIFFHPEKQSFGGWQQHIRKSFKVCHSSLKGEPCLRPVCLFAHPYVNNGQSSFHTELFNAPPMNLRAEPMMEASQMSITNLPQLPMRVSVIVKNVVDPVKELSQNMKEVNLE